MSRPAVETAFRSIAAAVDRVGEERTTLFLAKLSLLLSNELDDAGRVQHCIARAEAGLDAGRLDDSGPPKGE